MDPRTKEATNKEDIEKNLLKWLDALKGMKENGVISSDQYDELKRKVRYWWLERLAELEKGADTE
ncbi:hypothetical protein [Paenibacillus amylolyticus]|uniref:hypothetical protein n=1 Tax=Paenibacillus amylolyticus TaxID=1451 RepID=UPI000FD7928E|nr:hypothetical protein [Paenibacillus amylolyticus]